MAGPPLPQEEEEEEEGGSGEPPCEACERDLAAAGGLSSPALPSSPAAARLAPAMPCVADWLNNPFSIVQGIFGERGPGGAGILSAATRPPGGRRDGGFSSRGGGGGTGASPHGRAAGRGLPLTGWWRDEAGKAWEKREEQRGRAAASSFPGGSGQGDALPRPPRGCAALAGGWGPCSGAVPGQRGLPRFGRLVRGKKK